MTATAIVLLLAVLILAYANGANDNYKGVATLFGSGTTGYRTALIWATITTMAGSLLALILAGELVKTFSGKGLVPNELIGQPRFLLAVSLGGAITVLIATCVGMPVSTTHALTGGLVGAGLVASNGNIRLAGLGEQFLLPLIAAPAIAILLTMLLYPFAHAIRKRTSLTEETCICVGGVSESASLNPDGSLTLIRTGALIQIATASHCRTAYAGRVFGIEAGRILDALHFLSAGAVGFARGLNDAPKMVALLIAAEALEPSLGLALIAIAMAAGGWLSARRVAETMSRKIARLNPGQGLIANLITATMVILASWLGRPVSTTHVSVGSLFGIGIVNGTARRKMILSILLAWVTTLPTGAAVAALCYLVLSVVI